MQGSKKRPLPASLTFSHMSPLKKDAFELMAVKTDSDADSDGEDPQQQQQQQQEQQQQSQQQQDEQQQTQQPDRLAGLGSPSGRKHCNSDFKRLMTLGTGSFAKVILVQSQLRGDEGTLYAMKVLDAQQVLRQKQTVHTMTERSVLGQTSSHPFIVSLKYAFRTASTLNLVMDFCNGGELYYHLTRVHRFPEARAKFYAAELTLALEHLHSFNVVYRDLKPENVLIASDGHIMLADFGLSKEGIRDCVNGTDTFCGTPEYLAPEVLFRAGHGTAVDWWSLGIVLYEMLVGLPPWYSKNRHVMFQRICNHELVFPAQEALPLSEEARDVIAALLVKNPRERLGSGPVEAVKAHKFFADLDMDAVLRKELPAPWAPEPGKIYFDMEYTQMPFDSPSPTQRLFPSAAQQQHQQTQTQEHKDAEQQQQQPQQQQQQQQQRQQQSVSPLFPSSLVERAFSGFSYTDPAAALQMQQQHRCSVSPSSLGSVRSCCRPLAQRMRAAVGRGNCEQPGGAGAPASAGAEAAAEDVAAEDLAAQDCDGLGHFSLEMDDDVLDAEEGTL